MNAERPRCSKHAALASSMLCIVQCAMTPAAIAQCEQKRVQAVSPVSLDLFAYSATVSGEFAAIGHPSDDTIGVNFGSVYIYQQQSDGQWLRVQVFTPADIQASIGFGKTVDMDGDVLVVGADRDDVDGPNSGSAYVLRRIPSSNQWMQEAKLTASDGATDRHFGFRTEVDGDLIAISAVNGSSDPAEGHAVYLFRHTGGNAWLEETTLEAEVKFSVGYGMSLAIHDDVVAVGANRLTFDGQILNDEWVDIYRLNGDTGVWQRTQRIFNPANHPGQGFGHGVALSADSLLIASGYLDLSGPPYPWYMSAYAYSLDSATNQWAYQERLDGPTMNPALFMFTRSFDCDGQHVLIGGAYPLSGERVVGHFQRLPNGGWERLPDLVASDSTSAGLYGYSLGVSDGQAVIGAIQAQIPQSPGTGPGSAYFVELAGLDCNQNIICDDRDIATGTSDDINTNGIPDECEISGDVNGDGDVNVLDLLAVILAWGPCPPAPAECPADVAPQFTGDNVVNVSDLLVIINNWGDHL